MSAASTMPTYSRVIKTLTDLSVLIFFCAGLIFLLLPISWFPDFYDVRYMGWSAMASAVIVKYLPMAIRAPQGSPGFEQKNRAVDLFKFLIIFSLASNAFGDLGLYQLYRVGLEFDKLLHFIAPFVGVSIIFIILTDRFDFSAANAIAASFLIVMALSAGWEIYEQIADRLFKTRIAGEYGLNVNADTRMDIIFDFMGATVATALSALRPTTLRSAIYKITAQTG